MRECVRWSACVCAWVRVIEGVCVSVRTLPGCMLSVAAFVRVRGCV
jgi:hypothetical protein